MRPSSSPLVPVSWGELVDKITILEIKRERIADPAAAANVARELAALRRAGDRALRSEAVAPLFAALKAVNEALWKVEDAIRREEAQDRFGPEFIRLARLVYRHNDRRAELKRAVSEVLGSEMVEEKSYWAPAAGTRWSPANRDCRPPKRARLALPPGLAIGNMEDEEG